MITTINKIKNLGLVFRNYSWGSNLPAFERFNLIYGWNGSGKTTLSTLFDAIGTVPGDTLEYQIEDSTGAKYKHGDPFPIAIRVFNQDFIQENITLLEGRAKSISIILGESNKELAQKIATDKHLLNGEPGDSKKPGKFALKADAEKTKARTIKDRNSKFSDIASTIGAAIGGNALRTYRKPQAEKDFGKLPAKTELTETELANQVAIAKQESLAPLTLVNLPTFKSSDSSDLEMTAAILLVNQSARELLVQTPESEIISRLSANVDIGEWVEKGIALHEKHASKLCEYCQQSLPVARMKSLARHFSDADKKLKKALDNTLLRVEKLRAGSEALRPADSARLYPELRSKYDARLVELDAAKRDFLDRASLLVAELTEKKLDTSRSRQLRNELSIEGVMTHVDQLNEIVDAHNKKTAQFEELKAAAAQKLKEHYLSTIFSEIKNADAALMTLDSTLLSLQTEIEKLEKEIAENTAKISSDHKACDVLNEKLSTFLGHSELKFVPQPEGGEAEKGKPRGYKIMRGDKPATRLSEGEKTAIAFIYFVVHLVDQHFKIVDGIIVVDDPVSSLDSNSMYQAFSFLKNVVKDGKQVFILTHNFDFLKLLINWRHSAGETRYHE